MNQGKEASLVQREVAANAAGGIGGVPPLPYCAGTRQTQKAAPLGGFFYALRQDCTVVPSRAGEPALDHPGPQRIPAWESYASGGTPPHKYSAAAMSRGMVMAESRVVTATIRVLNR